MSSSLAGLRADALTHPAHDVGRLDLPLKKLYEGVVERIFCGLDAGADEAPRFLVQGLDLSMVQVVSSLFTRIGHGEAF